MASCCTSSANEILIFETENFTQVDKWDLSNLEEGLGQVSVSFGGFGGLDTVNDEPGFLTTTMTVEDPVQHRRMMGVARIDLRKKDLEFYTHRPGRRRQFRARARPETRHTAWNRLSAAISSGPSISSSGGSSRARSSTAGRGCRSRPARTGGSSTSTTPATRSIIYDGATYKYLRTITLDWRRDDAVLRRTAQARP